MLHHIRAWHEGIRAARAEAARARRQRTNFQEVVDRMSADIETRYHLLAQAADLVRQAAAVTNARVAAYRRGLIQGPWWKRLFGHPRCVTEPVPVYRPSSEWIDDLPLLRTQVVDTPEVISWEWKAFRGSGKNARGNPTISEPPSHEPQE